MADVNNSVAELITKEGYINGTNAKVAPCAYDSIGYANETQEGIEGVSEYSYGNNQNIPIGDATNLETNSTTLSKGLRAQASSIPRQIMNHFFGRTSFNLNKIHEWFLRFLGYFQTHLRQDNNLWSPTAKYELGDVCFVLDTLVVSGADKHIVRVFRCIKSVSGGLVDVRPVDADTHEVNTEYWQENNVYDELYALRFHGEATDVADGSITTAKLADEAVTRSKLAQGALGFFRVQAQIHGEETLVPFTDFPDFDYDPQATYSAFALPLPSDKAFLVSTCEIGSRDGVMGVIVKPHYVENGEVKTGTGFSRYKFGSNKFGAFRFGQEDTSHDTVTMTVVLF